jgi:pantothenate synthetase
MISSMFTTNSGSPISKSKSLPKWLANIQTIQMTGKEKVVIRIITITMEVALVITMETLHAEDAEEVEEAAAATAGEETIVSIYRMSNALIVSRKANIPLHFPSRKKNNERPNMVSKEDFKNLFQTSMKEMFIKRIRKQRTTMRATMMLWT